MIYCLAQIKVLPINRDLQGLMVSMTLKEKLQNKFEFDSTTEYMKSSTAFIL